MLTRSFVGVVLAWSAVFLTGCGSGAAPDSSPPPGKAAAAPPAGVQSVTLHLKGIT